MIFEFEDLNKPINCLIIRKIKIPCYDKKRRIGVEKVCNFIIFIQLNKIV
jgi:hypothetical protein